MHANGNMENYIRYSEPLTSKHIKSKSNKENVSRIRKLFTIHKFIEIYENKFRQFIAYRLGRYIILYILILSKILGVYSRYCVYIRIPHTHIYKHIYIYVIYPQYINIFHFLHKKQSPANNPKQLCSIFLFFFFFLFHSSLSF